MSKKKQNKNSKTRYRVKLGQQYCSLSMDFHDHGCCIPDATDQTAHVFATKNGADNAIDRTHQTQLKISESMIPEFKALKPLMFAGRLESESFEVDN